ncbi:MAG: carbamoyltransferase C-terminal domain-containing protein [Pseudomonadota bacterium]
MIILGINAAYHESAACLVRDGQVVAAVEEERFSRIKHAKQAGIDNADVLPEQAIDYCLGSAGIRWNGIDHIAWSLDPDERLRRNVKLADAGRMQPGGWGTREGEEVFHASNLRAREKLMARAPGARFHFIPHHLCHASSAFHVSPYDEACVISVDGIGESASTWLGYGRGARLECLNEIDYPSSIGFLWEKFSEFLGFDVYSGPGKVMGYSAITDPIGFDGADYLARMGETVELLPMGFSLDNDVFRFRTQDFSGMERLFGPRRPKIVYRYEEASIASALQAMTEKIMVHLARELHAAVAKKAGRSVDNLCIAGGVALNCLANAAVLEETDFTGLFIQPAANDAGTAMGAAMWVWHDILGNDARSFVMQDAFTGPGYGVDEIETLLKEESMSFERCDDIESRVARLIYDGNIVARFSGRLELGPRALGNRSILCDPTRFDMREIINTKVKFRESFRPFAPSVIEESMDSHFICGPRVPADDFMLLVYKTAEREHMRIPAVVQEDEHHHVSTSRVQTVSRERNPAYHRLIEEFKSLSGVGVVLNTSFNMSEPIVCTPRHALATFGRTHIDFLALGPLLVKRP